MADAKITRPAKTIRPAALRRGDKIGLIAPASSFNHERFMVGCDRLRQMGYEPVYSQNIFDRDIYFAARGNGAHMSSMNSGGAMTLRR